MPLVNPAALFRFQSPCRRRDRLWPPAERKLDDFCRLPKVAAVADAFRLFDLWMAWNFTIERLSKMRGVDPVVLDRACHDEA
jgi:hypothetical protein